MPGIHHTAIVTVRRIEMPAPGGKTVAMAVITAPDGVRVELVGPPQ
jgi:hypothetical protein